jgi:hypothetical protein
VHLCPNSRTTKRAEHLWDNWLNRDGGKPLRRPSIVTEFGNNRVLRREYKTSGLRITRDVICDECNETWMSELSNRAKARIGQSIVSGLPTLLDTEGIVELAAYAFVKAAVIDWSETERDPCLSRTTCVSFRRSLVSPLSQSASFPNGLHVWIAAFKRERAMEAYAHLDELGGRGYLIGGRILQITYVIGAFAFQVLFPKTSSAPAGHRARTWIAVRWMTSVSVSGR